MGVTLLLGSVFLGIKIFEYTSKFSHGIYPQAKHSRIYEKADLYYASAVRPRLQEISAELTVKPVWTAEDEAAAHGKRRIRRGERTEAENTQRVRFSRAGSTALTKEEAEHLALVKKLEARYEHH